MYQYRPCPVALDLNKATMICTEAHTFSFTPGVQTLPVRSLDGIAYWKQEISDVGAKPYHLQGMTSVSYHNWKRPSFSSLSGKICYLELGSSGAKKTLPKVNKALAKRQKTLGEGREMEMWRKVKENGRSALSLPEKDF